MRRDEGVGRKDYQGECRTRAIIGAACPADYWLLPAKLGVCEALLAFIGGCLVLIWRTTRLLADKGSLSATSVPEWALNLRHFFRSAPGAAGTSIP